MTVTRWWLFLVWLLSATALAGELSSEPLFSYLPENTATVFVQRVPGGAIARGYTTDGSWFALARDARSVRGAGGAIMPSVRLSPVLQLRLATLPSFGLRFGSSDFPEVIIGSDQNGFSVFSGRSHHAAPVARLAELPAETAQWVTRDSALFPLRYADYPALLGVGVGKEGPFYVVQQSAAAGMLYILGGLRSPLQEPLTLPDGSRALFLRFPSPDSVQAIPHVPVSQGVGVSLGTWEQGGSFAECPVLFPTFLDAHGVFIEGFSEKFRYTACLSPDFFRAVDK